MYTIAIRNAAGETLAQAEGLTEARLVYAEPYREGDAIFFSSDDIYADVQVDQAVEPGSVYLPEKAFAFSIPFGDAKNGYAPCAFGEGKKVLRIGPTIRELLSCRRVLSQNPFDQRGESGCYPHAQANVETRGEAQFWARNAIDGCRYNDRHGGWPYHSWGIGERRDAWLRVDFGRPVEIDAAALVLRADFPHDAWWEQGTLECSDGYAIKLPLVKTPELQTFALGRRVVEWVRLYDLVKADDPSPFPALTQLAIYGKEAK